MVRRAENGIVRASLGGRIFAAGIAGLLVFATFWTPAFAPWCRTADCADEPMAAAGCCQEEAAPIAVRPPPPDEDRCRNCLLVAKGVALSKARGIAPAPAVAAAGGLFPLPGEAAPVPPHDTRPALEPGPPPGAVVLRDLRGIRLLI